MASRLASTSFRLERSSRDVAISAVIAIATLLFIVSYLNWPLIHSKKAVGASMPQLPMVAVVGINCPDGSGSGTMFSADGTIVTNYHVIEGAASCEVTIPNPETGQISTIYMAKPVITPRLSREYDVALLKIEGPYKDAKGRIWGAYPTSFVPFNNPVSCSTSTAPHLGDSMRLYGYPVTNGGYNLTVTSGIVSSFDDDGTVLTSAKIDSGNSGGLAVDQDGCYLGIPSAVAVGNYQNLGAVIPGNVVQQYFLSSVPAKPNPVGLQPPGSIQAVEDASTGQ